MYVCVCLAVTDSKVREVIHEGAATVDAVTRACGAGGDCGACRGMIGEMIEDHLDGQHPSIAGCPKSVPSEPHLIAETALVRSSRAA
jgi:bacterioferritin-associated ferredoxin